MRSKPSLILSSGSLSLTQSILTHLRRDFEAGKGLAVAPSVYDAARVVGEQVRKVAEMDRAAAFGWYGAWGPRALWW